MVSITSSELRATFLREFVKALIIGKIQREISRTGLSQPLIRTQQTPIPFEPMIPLIRRYKEKILGGDIVKREIRSEKNEKKIQEPTEEGEQFLQSIKIEQTPQIATTLLYGKKQPISPLRAPPGFLKMRPAPQKIQQGGITQRRATPMIIGSEFSQIGSERLKYILFLMTDTTIASIECPGPNKQLVLNKSGAIKPAEISLTAEEINEIMKEISKKTRIPLNPGLFKTIFDNYIITAVISEFVGTRFIIERVNPPQNPLPPQRSYR